jgi:hypothetical protein
MRVLVVTNPCRGYAIGERITDPKIIAEILTSEHANHVVQADHPDVKSEE